LIKIDFQTAFEQADILLGPTSPQPAFKLGEKTDDQVAMYLQDIYTIAGNLAGLPAMSIPAGFSSKLPVGVQLIGNYMQEGRILNAAHQFQQQTDWHLRSPGAVGAGD
jgi:aspartyl-tRNA(Asn)/glutamyl-tRNA(Gln) amidotransferase subunit A